MEALDQLIGGVIGFLWFNAFPAELFMGDTGSMALGGAIAPVMIATTSAIEHSPRFKSAARRPRRWT